MLLIGESINAAIPAVAKALSSSDEAFLLRLAREQVDRGAQVLDVSAGGLLGRDEAADLAWLVRVLQQNNIGVPLMLDSPNPEVLASAVEVCQGPLFLNSITAEERKLERLLPIIRERDCVVVGLCLDDKGIPGTASERLEVARRLVEAVTQAGVRPQNVYLDPLALSLGSNPTAGAIYLSTLLLIRQHFPQVGTICALSNVSSGLPARGLLNRTFLAMIMAIGIDALLADVRDQALWATLWSAQALLGKDAWCRNYLRAYRLGKLQRSKG